MIVAGWQMIQHLRSFGPQRYCGIGNRLEATVQGLLVSQSITEYHRTARVKSAYEPRDSLGCPELIPLSAA